MDRRRLQDMHATAETMADITEPNNPFGSVRTTDGTADNRPSPYMSSSSLAATDPPGWRMLLSNFNLGSSTNNRNRHYHQQHPNNPAPGAERIDNISQIWDILNAPNDYNPRHSAARQADVNVERRAALETDSLWRLRPDGREGDDDDISVDSQLFSDMRFPTARRMDDISVDSQLFSGMRFPRARRMIRTSATTSSMDTDIAVNRNSSDNVSETERDNQQGNERDVKPPASIFVNHGSNNLTSGNSNTNSSSPTQHIVTRSMSARRQPRESTTDTATVSASSSNDDTASIIARSRPRRVTVRASSRERSAAPPVLHPNTRAQRKRNRDPSSASKKSKVARKQRCVHAKVKTDETTTPCDDGGTKEKTELQDETNKCCICLDIPTSKEVANINGCKHIYCFGCIEEWAKRENTCPQCKVRFTEIKRVNIKTGKRKGKGGKKSEGPTGNVKKVKDRDQTSDYRQQNHLQSLFAHMEAHGLNILFSSGSQFLHESSLPPLPHYLQQAANTSHATRTRATSLRGNMPISGSIAASLAAGVGGPGHARFSSILLNQGSMSPPSQLRSPSATGMSGHARVLRRGTARQGSTMNVRSGDSLLYRSMRGNLDFNFGATGNDGQTGMSPSSTQEMNFNDGMASREATASSPSSNSAYDPELLEPQHYFMAGLRPLPPPSFAANADQEGAGSSADRALEILDDSDSDSVQEAY